MITIYEFGCTILEWQQETEKVIFVTQTTDFNFRRTTTVVSALAEHLLTVFSDLVHVTEFYHVALKAVE